MVDVLATNKFFISKNKDVNLTNHRQFIKTFIRNDSLILEYDQETTNHIVFILFDDCDITRSGSN